MSDEISRRPAASIDPETAADGLAADGLAADGSGGSAGMQATGDGAAAAVAVSEPKSAVALDPDGAARLPPDGEGAEDAPEGDAMDLNAADAAGPAEPDGPDGGGEGPEITRFGETLSPEDLERLSDILLAVLFATETPLTAARLGHAAGATAAQVRKGLEHLEQRIVDQRLPLCLQETAGQFRLLTAPAFHDHLLRLRAIKKSERLTPAALETLAVIAYRQPVIRAEIEAIRGVKVGPVLRLLLDKKLIRTGERKDVPGRPIQYETTKEFLDRFGIKSVADLPTVTELKRGMV